MDEKAWLQSSLPVSKGGLGLRHATDISVPAFMASSACVRVLVQTLLQSVCEDVAWIDGLQLWTAASACSPPVDSLLGNQPSWERPLVAKATKHLHEIATTDRDRARLLGVRGREAGAWLHAIPSPSLGTLLDNDTFRVAVSLRLGSLVCSPHTCVCGSSVDESGTHGLSCRFSPGRRSRHAAVNDLLHRALVSAGVPSVLEPPGTSRDDGKYPNGITLVP
jgi:hypothetical protein